MRGFILAIAFSVPIMALAESGAAKGPVAVMKVDVMRGNKTLGTEVITMDGVRATYGNIKALVKTHGILSSDGWRAQGANMTATNRCGFLLETFFILQGINEGKLDATPAEEQTANNIIVGLSKVNEASQIRCERHPD